MHFILCSSDSVWLFLCVSLWHVPPRPAAVAALLQPVGFSSLGSLLLQDLSVIQDLQAWDLTDDVLSVKAKGNGNTCC